MRSSVLGPAFDAVVLFSTGAGVASWLWSLRRATGGATGERREGGAGRALVLLAHPLAQLALVSGLLWLNQILFGAYILRVHGGDTSFVSRYAGRGWFEIAASDPWVVAIAARSGDGRWLAPSLLRVQAFLELPFALFAYLAVARMLGYALYRSLVRPHVLALASVSFSVTFSLVEIAMRNPWTRDDLILRAASAALVPVYIARIARREERSRAHDGGADAAASGPSGVLGLLAFLAGAGAVSYAVLAIYDAFLLYNLAHLPRYATGLLVAVAVAAAASFAAPRVDAALASRGSVGASAAPASVALCVASLRAFTFLFFVPSLSIRYWGTYPSAILGGLLVVVLAIGAGAAPVAVRLARSARPVASVASYAFAAACALAAGGAAGALAVVLAGPGALPELTLARLAISFLATTIVIFRAVEIAVCWSPHEAKAQADEA